MRVWRGGCPRYLAVVTALFVVLLGVPAGVGCGGQGSPSTSGDTVSVVTTAPPAPSYTVVTTAPVRPGVSRTTGTVAGSASTSSLTTTTVETSGGNSTTSASTTTLSSTTTTKAVALTVSGPSGTRQYSLAELAAMASTQGYGGWKNQLGNITAPRLYKGVAIGALQNLVGGGSSITVTASDGYEQTLSTAELEGAVSTYDPVSGDTVSAIAGEVTVIVAYQLNGGPLSSGEGGPLRVAFVSPQADQVTDSNLWVKFVSGIQVR